MSTRGACGFRLGGVDKVMYNRSDSYPDWLGVHVLQFLQGVDLEELPETVRGIELVDQDSKPTPEQIQHCRDMGTVDLDISKQSENDWYRLVRDAQGELQFYVDGLKYMLDAHDFLGDSLFCEWAYIVNLDEGVLEVYNGFNQDPGAPGRYASLKDEENSKYFGVALLVTIPFWELKDMLEKDFLARIEQAVPAEE